MTSDTLRPWSVKHFYKLVRFGEDVKDKRRYYKIWPLSSQFQLTTKVNPLILNTFTIFMQLFKYLRVYEVNRNRIKRILKIVSSRSVFENTTLSKTGLFWNLMSWALFSLHARELIREHTTNTITSITSFPFSCGFSLCFLLPLLVTPKSSIKVTKRWISNFNIGDLSLFVLNIVCVSAVACITLKAFLYDIPGIAVTFVTLANQCEKLLKSMAAFYT